jgi:DNA-binding transcriptional LysR family regulator
MPTGPRVFLAVARLGSFSKAGRQLQLAPSSVSRQISQLEDSLVGGCSRARPAT